MHSASTSSDVSRGNT